MGISQIEGLLINIITICHVYYGIGVVINLFLLFKMNTDRKNAFTYMMLLFFGYMLFLPMISSYTQESVEKKVCAFFSLDLDQCSYKAELLQIKREKIYKDTYSIYKKELNETLTDKKEVLKILLKEEEMYVPDYLSFSNVALDRLSTKKEKIQKMIDSFKARDPDFDHARLPSVVNEKFSVKNNKEIEPSKNKETL